MSIYPSPTGLMIGMDLAYILFVVSLWELVPRSQAPHSTGHG